MPFSTIDYFCNKKLLVKKKTLSCDKVFFNCLWAMKKIFSAVLRILYQWDIAARYDIRLLPYDILASQAWYNIRSFICRRRISSHDSAISYRRYITRSTRNGYRWKKSPLSVDKSDFFSWRRRRDLKLLRNPSCGSRKNLRGSPTPFLDFFDRCANPFSLHPLRGAQKRSPRRSPSLGFIPFFHIKITGTKTVSVILAQKEGFEPSRRLPDLLP